MNLPNKLTMLRVILVPVFCVFVLIDSIKCHYLFSLIIFVAAAVTDTLDGRIARKHNLVTSFGKFMDPLADKVLVLSALIIFVQLGFCPSWVVILVITRDLAVDGIRLIASSQNGLVIAANIWGKIKTTFQMVSICTVLLLAELTERCCIQYLVFLKISKILMYIVAALTVLSGTVYIIQNKDCINSFN